MTQWNEKKTVDISVNEYLSTLWAHEGSVPNMNLLDVPSQAPLCCKYLEISWRLIFLLVKRFENLEWSQEIGITNMNNDI